jgi:hypothetical protein
MSSDFSKILAIDECFVACGENVLDIRREVKASCPARTACPIGGVVTHRMLLHSEVRRTLTE